VRKIYSLRQADGAQSQVRHDRLLPEKSAIMEMEGQNGRQFGRKKEERDDDWAYPGGNS